MKAFSLVDFFSLFLERDLDLDLLFDKFLSCFSIFFLSKNIFYRDLDLSFENLTSFKSLLQVPNETSLFSVISTSRESLSILQPFTNVPLAIY